MRVTEGHNNIIFAVLFYAIIQVSFINITDIYACIVNLVEHSYGYYSTEILLTDTQVVHLIANPYDGDYDTDQDILARDGHVEFYIDQDHSFGWGETHDSVENERDSKAFRWHFGTEDQVSGTSNEEGYYFYNANKNTPGRQEGRYKKVYRLKEEYQ